MADHEDLDRLSDAELDEALRLGLRIESLLKSIRARLGVLTFLAVVPICIGFGVGLGVGLADSGTDDSAARLVGGGTIVILIALAAILLLVPADD